MMPQFLQPGYFDMGILERPAIQDELQSQETQDKRAKSTVLPDCEDRLAAARGMVVGTVLAMIVWAVILWGLKWQISGW